jgi:hypothetical protein
MGLVRQGGDKYSHNFDKGGIVPLVEVFSCYYIALIQLKII